MAATSNLVGVFPVKSPHRVLRDLYKMTLLALRKHPRDAAYRKNTEAIVCHRLNVLEEAGDDVREIEDTINCGRIEHLIAQAKAEMQLAWRMTEWKPWDPLMEQPPPGQWEWPPAAV